MGIFILRRLLSTLPVMTVVALFVFGLLYVAPGDPATMIAGDQATPADVERIRISLGLDQPFAIRFSAWALGALHGDLGNSLFSGQSVASMIVQRIPPTLSLMVLTLLISVSAAVPMGVVAAARQGGLIDRAVSVFAVLGFSLPVFVLGYLLAYAFALRLGWFPVQGYVPPSKASGHSSAISPCLPWRYQEAISPSSPASRARPCSKLFPRTMSAQPRRRASLEAAFSSCML
jgi:peptide/nickel transport system permease protein